jgi:hypothetical protein
MREGSSKAEQSSHELQLVTAWEAGEGMANARAPMTREWPNARRFNLIHGAALLI